MRIGELSRRSRVTVRMLRYYEERGLVSPGRSSNGYRAYDESDVQRVALVSSLIRSGLPTRLILPILDPGAATDADLRPAVQAELARLDHNVSCLTMSRDAVRALLDRLDRRDHDDTPGSTHPTPSSVPC